MCSAVWQKNNWWKKAGFDCFIMFYKNAGEQSSDDGGGELGVEDGNWLTGCPFQFHFIPKRFYSPLYHEQQISSPRDPI